MRRIVQILMVFVMISGAAYTFETKRRAEIAADEIRQLTRQIEQEKETIALLKADLNVLTQAGRLQKLTERHAETLQLETMKVEQIITLDELPKRPLDLSPFEKDESLGGYADGDLGSSVNIQ